MTYMWSLLWCVLEWFQFQVLSLWNILLHSMSFSLRNFFGQDAIITYSFMENTFGPVVKMLSLQWQVSDLLQECIGGIEWQEDGKAHSNIFEMLIKCSVHAGNTAYIYLQYFNFVLHVLVSVHCLQAKIQTTDIHSKMH
jgi:hypothetical protein